jgi:phosphoglycerate dehydrogenase-like enzyme
VRPAPPSRPVVAVLTDGGPGGPELGGVTDTAVIRYAADLAALRAALRDAHALFVWNFRTSILRDAWADARDLRWIHVAAAGVDTVLFPELVESDVIVTNSRGVFDQAIGEYVLGLMLAFEKDLPGTIARQRRRAWEHRETGMLGGRTAVVVGAGGIGRAIGRLAHAVGMRVIGVARTARPRDPDLGTVVPASELASVVGDADYLVIATPLTPETHGMIGASVFARMKPGARLINVGRGAIVDEGALLGALRAGRIAGAALDVFAREPLPPDDPLWDAPGVIVSPHMSGDFAGSLEGLAALFRANFARWRRGAPLLNVVDKRRGYVPGLSGEAEPARRAAPPGRGRAEDPGRS